MNADCHTPVGAACIPAADGREHKLITVFGKDDKSNLIYAEVVGNNPLDMARKAAGIIKEKGNIE